jgi:flagellar basal-body rod modification protein FlgD
MATVGSTPQAAAGGTLAQAGAKTAGSIGDSVTEDRFLKLLMAQMKNQDPLNPLDNAQVTSQMAQISTVNGIEQLNATIKAMQAGNADMQAVQATSLVGHQIYSSGNAITLADGQASGAFELPEGAEKVTLVIKSQSGMVVDTQDLQLPPGRTTWPAGIHAFSWDGKTSSGAPSTPGNYSFEVKAASGKAAATANPLSISTVDGVNRSNGSVSANTSRGAIDISAIRRVM